MDLKKVDKEKNPGLAKLPTRVRNKMGYHAKGGKVMAGIKKSSKKKKKNMKKRVKAMGGGSMKKRVKAMGGGSMKKRVKAMGGGAMKKRLKRGGKVK